MQRVLSWLWAVFNYLPTARFQSIILWVIYLWVRAFKLIKKLVYPWPLEMTLFSNILLNWLLYLIAPILPGPNYRVPRLSTNLGIRLHQYWQNSFLAFVPDASTQSSKSRHLLVDVLSDDKGSSSSFSLFCCVSRNLSRTISKQFCTFCPLPSGRDLLLTNEFDWYSSETSFFVHFVIPSTAKLKVRFGLVVTSFSGSFLAKVPI